MKPDEEDILLSFLLLQKNLHVLIIVKKQHTNIKHISFQFGIIQTDKKSKNDLPETSNGFFMEIMLS